MGIDEATWNSLGSGGQAILSATLPVLQKKLLNNEPTPAVLSKSEMNKLWKEAKNDPTINKYYAEQLEIGTKAIEENLSLMVDDFDQMSREQQKQYIDAKKQLDEAKAEAGQVYSGFRKQAQTELAKQNADVIASSKRQAKSKLNELESQFEQTFGSNTLTGLKLPGVGGAQYTPIGGLAGTQATSKLQDELNLEQELAQEKEQGISIKNISNKFLPI